DPAGMQLRNARKTDSPDTRIDWDRRINWLAWRFAVARGSARVPKGWLMMGFQVSQDETQMTLYTFMPAKEAAAMPGYEQFTPLIGRAALEKGQLSIREGADQRRLLKA